MSATIRVDDGTNPPVNGTVEIASTFIGTAITLSNFDDTGILGWRWTLVDRPIGSSASLATPSAATTTLTPDIGGGYLVRLETYADVPRTIADSADEQVVGIALPAPFDWQVPAAGETSQRGSRGWAQPREVSIRDVHTFMNSGMPQLVGVVNQEVDGADPETVLGGFVLDGNNFPATALKLRLMGVLTVAGLGDGALRLYDMGLVGSPASPGVLRATADHPNASAGGPLVFDTALTVVASPGVDADEIISARHRYELRAELVGGGGGDTLKVHNGAVVLEG